jgi:undecaprenyl-diphosphatase
VCLLIVHALTSTVSQTTLGWADNSALSWIHSLRTPLLDRIFLVATHVGSALLLLPASIVLTATLVSRGRPLDAWLLGLGLAGAMLISQLAKAIFSRPRPELFDPLVTMPANFSFPSGHSTQIAAFALSLALLVYRSSSTSLSRIITGLSILVAIAVGISRIYLQIHYPSDVLAGAMLAVLWVTGLYTLLSWIRNNSSQYSLE